MKRDIEDKLKGLGPQLPVSSTEKMQLLWNMVTEFVQTFKNMIGGRLIKNFQKNEKQQMNGGARVKQFYANLYEEYDDPRFQVTEEYSDPDIERAIKQHEGYSMPGFPSVHVFNYLLKPVLSLIKEPAFETLQDVYLYLDNLAQEIANKVFARFPGLVGEIMEVVSKVLSEERDSAKEILDDIIESE